MLIPHNPPINSVSDTVFTGSTRQAFSSSFFFSHKLFLTWHFRAACPIMYGDGRDRRTVPSYGSARAEHHSNQQPRGHDAPLHTLLQLRLSSVFAGEGQPAAFPGLGFWESPWMQ